METAKHGADRQALHEVIRRHSLAAWAQVSAGLPNPLVDTLCAEPAITRYLAPEQARACLDAGAYVGDAPDARTAVCGFRARATGRLSATSTQAGGRRARCSGRQGDAMLSNDEIRSAIPHALLRVDLPGLGPRIEGKVRDIYVAGDRRILITTDRVSAFDRVLGAIPYKGQVLNQLSAWWFGQTRDVVGNHVLSVPDPNVTIAREAVSLPVEVIVRGYITGVTSTSLWTLYHQGVHQPYGLDLPAGLHKNDPLPEPVITPTTKATGGAHDERLTPAEVVERGLVAPELWAEIQRAALAIFRRGQEVAQRAGLILVDTKYEFGLIDGRPALIDEVHTPDSSRYWVAESYAVVQGTDREPENFDKEYLRLWFARQGYRGEGTPPAMPDDFVAEVAARYVAIYERLTGEPFVPGAQPAAERIRARRWRRLLSARSSGGPTVSLVPIIMGSRSDMPHAQAIADALHGFGIASELRVASAHKTARHLLDLLAAYEADPQPKVYITVAGRSNALSGMVDANVGGPVIACPPYSDRFGGTDLFSSLRMPSGVAPAVVLEPAGAALLAAKILALHDPELRARISQAQQAAAQQIVADDEQSLMAR